MSLSLTIDGVDFTAKWRLYESSWTMRAWQGESAQSSFILDDLDGTIDHANLAAKKIVEVWEDASGGNKCMYRGRVANKTLGMAPQQAPGVAMRWTVLTEDYNVDLEGIEVQGWERGEETDDERVEALRLDFLNGLSSISPRARETTNLDGTYIGSDPLDAAPLYDEMYTDVDPLTVLQRIVEMTGRVFFVYLDDDGDGELVYFNRASDADDLLSDIEVRDDGEVEGVDDVTIFAPYKGPQAGDHGGQNIMTGGSVRYMGGGFYRASDIDGREATYDKWESSIRNDNIRREEAAQDFLEANVDASEETFTYLATIDMRAEYAHLIRAGMRVRLKRKRANQTTSQRLLVVTSEHKPIKPDADAEAIYQVNLEIGRPLNPHFTRSRFNIPIPTTLPEPGEDRFLGSACSKSGTDFPSDFPAWSGSNEWVLDVTVSNNVPAGVTLIATVSTNKDGTNAARDRQVYDASGNTWVLDGESPVQGTADYIAQIWRGTITTALSSGDYVRFATKTGGGGNDSGARCMGVYQFGRALTSPNEGANANAFNSTPTVGSSQVADLTVLAASIPDNTVGGATGDSDWDALVPYIQIDGSASNQSGIIGQYIEPGTGDSWTGSIDQSRDWSLLSVGYDAGSPSGGGSGSTDVGAVGGPDDVEVGSDPGVFIPAGSVLEHLDITNGGPYHMAEDVTIADSGGYYTGTDVEAALQEIGAGGIGGGSLEVAEQDGSPDVSDVTRIELDGPGLTNDGGGQVTISAAALVHAHSPPSGTGFRGVSLRRTTDFTSTNANTSIPDFDTVEYDTDGFYDAGDPERITIPADMDGLMMQFFAAGLWATNTDNYTEMKLYRNGTGVEEPLAVTQHVPATSYNTGQELNTRPIQVSTGDYFTITFRTPANETVLTYDDMSLVFAAWMVGPGDSGGALSDDTPLVESGSGDPGVSDEGSRSDHVHPAAAGGGGVPNAILLESGHAVPFTFDEILQESDGSDFLWASE